MAKAEPHFHVWTYRGDDQWRCGTCGAWKTIPESEQWMDDKMHEYDPPDDVEE